MEDVRVCRFCGHIDPVDSRGRCKNCGLFLGLDIVSRTEAEGLARRQRLRFLRHRVVRLLALCIVLAGVVAWVMRAFFDLGVNPPRPSTTISARMGPHTWGQFRRTADNSGFIADPAPLPSRVKWTYRTSGPLVASPAVVENHVYLTTDDGRAVALDRHTGQPLWEYRSGWPSASTPAVAGDTVIFSMRPGRVVALNRHTGERRWETDLKSPVLASPVVVQGTVYIGAADKKLYALDAHTGQRRWSFRTQDWIISAVAYAGDRIIVASQGSRLHVVGAATGHKRFIYDTGLGRHVQTSPVVQGDRVYFGSVGGLLWAIDWRGTTYPLERALLFWKTNLYVWGILLRPPVQKGSVWSKRIGGDIMHTPAIAHNTVYVATSQGKVAALDAVAGTQQWVTTLTAAITAAPTVAGDIVLIGTKSGIVFGLHAQTGNVAWTFKTAGPITGSPIIVGDTLYVVSHDGNLYAAANAG